MRRRLLSALAVGAVMAGLGAAPAAPAAASQPGGGFVTRQDNQLRLDGHQFRFAGSNNYYLMYKSRLMVDDVFADAKAAGFTVIRTWGFLDIGNQDGSNSVHGKADGVYFQYWDGTRPTYNDGADGLQRLDYVLAAARQAGIKLVIPLTNNWRDFGGMDQYVRWRGGQFHDDFYSDPVIRGWYKDWITHVLERTNTITGVRYKDDPTIMTWELGNEPRCIGSGVYPRSANCTTQTLIAWADEMTRHIKSVDNRHLASVGDEGFFCDDPANSDWTRNCNEGVDTLAFTRLPAVDVMSYHLYPDFWGKDLPWVADWIERHVREAREIGKPVMLGEFGWLDKSTRNPVYQQWTNTFDKAGGTGWLYWILSGIQDDGSLYPDFDGFTVYCPTPVCKTLTNAHEELAGPERSRPPVADHDVAVTEFNQPVTLTPPANDIAYRTKIRPNSVDLDPTAAGQQRDVNVQGGQFSLGSAGVVSFTPTEGFVGKAVAHYVIQDQAGRWSNVADLVVTVKPDPTAAIVIASFETGVEGWAPGNWQSNAGTVSQTDEFATHGSFSLRVTTAGADGGWFGLNFPTPLNLSGKALLRYDLQASAAAGTSLNAAIQVTSSFEWCQGNNWGWANPGTSTTVEIDLINGTSCVDLPSKLGDVRAIWVWISGGGQFDFDHVRAE